MDLFSVSDNWDAITDLTASKLECVNNQQEVMEQVMNHMSSSGTSAKQSNHPQVRSSISSVYPFSDNFTFLFSFMVEEISVFKKCVK